MNFLVWLTIFILKQYLSPIIQLRPAWYWICYSPKFWVSNIICDLFPSISTPASSWSDLIRPIFVACPPFEYHLMYSSWTINLSIAWSHIPKEASHYGALRNPVIIFTRHLSRRLTICPRAHCADPFCADSVMYATCHELIGKDGSLSSALGIGFVI